jgi:hypothetical protein
MERRGYKWKKHLWLHEKWQVKAKRRVGDYKPKTAERGSTHEELA